MSDYDDFQQYEPGMGRLPTIELYETRGQEPGNQDVETMYNWRLIAANGEKLARGSGAKYGLFRYASTAWANLLLTVKAFHGGFVPTAPPPQGTDIVLLTTNINPKPRLRIKRQ